MSIFNNKSFARSSVFKQNTPPSSKRSQWIDTSSGEAVLKTYDDGTGSWVTVGGSSSGGSLSQVTKLGVSASSTSPKLIDITIPSTTDFKLPPIEILKFIAGTNNKVTTEVAFDNADSTDFEANSYVTFNGTMQLKTSYSQAMTDDGALSNGKTFTGSVDINNFKDIETIEIV